MNIPTKIFCLPLCILFVCSESCFYMFGRIDWVGWRLTHGEDGRGWSTGVSQDPPFHHQSILMKDHFMETAKIVTDFLVF